MKIPEDKFRRAFLFLTEILLYCILLRLSYCLLVEGTPFPKPSFRENVIFHAINILAMMAMTASNAFIVFYLNERFMPSKSLLVKTLLDFVMTFGAMFGLYALFIALYQNLFKLQLNVDVAGIFICYSTTFLVIEILYYVNRSREALKREEYAKREALQYKYDALKAQVNPHFLFNSLNILMDIIETDSKKAGEFTLSLSHIYRYVLTTQNQSTVTLSEELDFLDSYIEVLAIKYNNFMKVEVSDRADYGKRNIIPFTLQLLVENITKHNTISEEYPMDVTINIDSEGLTVVNTVRPKRTNTHTGLGLRYISSQYEAHGRRFEAHNDGQIFTAKIPFL